MTRRNNAYPVSCIPCPRLQQGAGKERERHTNRRTKRKDHGLGRKTDVSSGLLSGAAPGGDDTVAVAVILLIIIIIIIIIKTID